MTEVMLYMGERGADGQIALEMRDRFLDHYLDHRPDTCGFHSCRAFRRMREQWAIERNGGVEHSLDQTTPTDCPKCGSELIERTNSKTGIPFTGCSSFPDCKYIYRAPKVPTGQ